MTSDVTFGFAAGFIFYWLLTWVQEKVKCLFKKKIEELEEDDHE